VVNPLVLERFGAQQATYALPTQSAEAAAGAHRTGLSAFGYSGTIVHAILQSTSGSRTPGSTFAYKLVYRRQCFSWITAAGESMRSCISSSQVPVLPLYLNGYQLCAQQAALSGAASYLDVQAVPEPPALDDQRKPYVRTSWDGDGRVALIELAHTAHFNAISPEIAMDLAEAVTFTVSQGQTRAIVLQGSGPHFSIGAYPGKQPKVTFEVLRTVIHLVAVSVARLRSLSQPTISALHGYLAGGGMALALSTWCRVCERSAQME